MKNVKSYFVDYPESKQVHVTSDGYMFHQEGDANLHAQSLEKKGITTITREQSDSMQSDEATKQAEAEKIAAEKKAEADKKAADKQAEADKKAADKKAEADKKAADKQAEADKKAADKKAEADKKAAEQTDKTEETK